VGIGRVDFDQLAASYDQRFGALQYEGVASTLFSRLGPVPQDGFWKWAAAPATG